MVFTEDYEIQLVEATTKVPFKEHTHIYGKVYVEVEPDAEYYIAIRRTSNQNGRNAVEVFVDGKSVDYASYYDGEKTKSVAYYGLRSLQDHKVNHLALKFFEPKKKLGTCTKIERFGTVVIMIFEATETVERILDPSEESRVTFQPVTEVHVEDEADVCTKNKKYLRSGIGATTCQSWASTVIVVGALLQTVTLHYGSARGLVKAGILKVPATIDRPFPIAKRPTSTNRISIKKEKVGKRCKSEMEMTREVIEITADESTDDEIEEVEKPIPEVICLPMSESCSSSQPTL